MEPWGENERLNNIEWSVVSDSSIVPGYLLLVYYGSGIITCPHEPGAHKFPPLENPCLKSRLRIYKMMGSSTIGY